MSSAIFPRAMPMTEEEYFALGETPDRVELFDGSLLVTPAPTPRHQHISRRLANALEASGPGLYVVEAVNVRLRHGLIPIPDIVITEAIDFDSPVIDAEAVHLVCEIMSPSNAATDKVLKMHHYAVAGIPWYLLVEQETGALHLYRLVGDRYQEQSVTRAGQALELTEPVQVTIFPADLLPPG
jgi:Uma2 family endonuclease